MKRLAIHLALVLAVLCLAALSVAAGRPAASGGRRAVVRSLVVIAARAPRFIPSYVTQGSYPSVSGRSGLVATNAALRQAILDDQHAYARSAKRYVRMSRSGGNPYKGLYRTYFRRSLTSASTVVVSTLIPALKLYPGGNDGQTWISATVDVRSGKRVSLAKLFAHPRKAYRALSAAWVTSFLRAHPNCGMCRGWLRRYKPSYPARLYHLHHYALLPRGVAIGFPQPAAGSRLVAVIPYRLISDYLNPVGRRLVAGVRASLKPT